MTDTSEKLKYLKFLKTLHDSETISSNQYEDISLFTVDELKSLGRDVLYEYEFGNWDHSLVLLPLWIVNFVEPDSIMTSINGDTKMLKDCDDDSRFGCIAYGFKM